VEVKPRGYPVQVFAVQIIQRDIAAIARPDARHRWVVFAAPSIRESQRIDAGQGRADGARDGAAPIDAGAKNIKQERLGHALSLRV